MKRIPHLLILCIVFLLAACQNRDDQSPTSGSLSLVIPEAIEPVMRGEVAAFLDLYRQNGAQIATRVETSEEAIHLFLRDSLRLLFSTRRLTATERASVEKEGNGLTEIALAYDGVAVIVQEGNPVEKATVGEIRGILDGTITRWEQLKDHGKLRGAITTVLAEPSDESVYLQQRLFRGGPLRAHITQTGSSAQAMRMVSKDARAVGFVGAAWLDSLELPLHPLALAMMPGDADTAYAVPGDAYGRYFAIHPANIYQNSYAFKRTIMMYSRPTRVDLATGFSAYVASADGQRLFLRRNLVPGTQPIRLRPTN